MYRSVYHHRSHHVSEERGLETVEHQPNPIALRDDEVRRIGMRRMRRILLSIHSRNYHTFFFSSSSHFFSLLFSLFTKHSRISRPWRFDTRLLSVPIRADFRESSMSLALGRGWGGDRGQTGGRLALDFDTHVARKGRIYHTRGLLIMAIVIIIIIIIIIIVIIPKGVIRYRDS